MPTARGRCWPPASRRCAATSQLLSDYPYTELDLVDVTVGNGAAGIEFPQLVFIGGNYYDE